MSHGNVHSRPFGGWSGRTTATARPVHGREASYIGPIFRARLNQEFQVRTLNDLVQRFSHQPAWTAVEIEDEIVRMVRNPNQETCSRGRNNTEDEEPLYHVSDVNQCAFNAIVELLREVHERREDHEDLQFDPQPNVPHAADVLFRQRGDPGAKRCGCLDEGRCNDDAQCRWTPGAQTGLVDAQGAPMGTCTPNQNNRDGFRRERHNQPDQHMPTMADQAQAQALPNRPNSFYVHQWRVIGGSRHNRITRLEGFDQGNHHRITCDCVPANERPETENRNRLYFEGYLRDGDSPRRIHELNCDCRNEEGWTDSDSESSSSSDSESSDSENEDEIGDNGVFEDNDDGVDNDNGVFEDNDAEDNDNGVFEDNDDGANDEIPGVNIPFELDENSVCDPIDFSIDSDDGRGMTRIFRDVARQMQRPLRDLSFYVNTIQPGNTIRKTEPRTFQELLQQHFWPGLNVHRIVVECATTPSRAMQRLQEYNTTTRRHNLRSRSLRLRNTKNSNKKRVRKSYG